MADQTLLNANTLREENIRENIESKILAGQRGYDPQWW